jgi:hypothetical protein
VLRLFTKREGEVVAHSEQLAEADESVFGVDAALLHTETKY